MPHVKQDGQPLLAALESLEARLPRDTNRPVYMAIRRTFIEKFVRYYCLLNKTVSGSLRARVVVTPGNLAKAAREIERLEKDSSKLASLLFPESKMPAAIRARRWDYQMGRRDWCDPEIVKFLRRSLRRWKPGRGQPATLQPIGLRALDLRMVDPKRWSWNALPKELCRCGATEHSFRCRENIRREVYLMKEVLADLEVTLPIGK